MEAVDGYNPVELNESQMRELEGQLAEGYGAFHCAATDNYGTPNIKRLRDEYRSGQITLAFDPRAKKHMAAMRLLEGTVASAFVRMAAQLSSSFCLTYSDRLALTSGDYLQEAMLAVYDSMYTYNGENGFGTYVYWCVKNRLISFVRAELRAARNRSSGDMLDTIPSRDRDRSELDLMIESIEMTALSDLEREMLSAFLDGEKKMDIYKRLSESRLNPGTDKPYTVQRLSQIFIDACQKVRATHSQREARYAA